MQKYNLYCPLKLHFLLSCIHIVNCFIYSSINGDGAAEPVSDTFSEGEDNNLGEDFSSSWPTTITSTQTGAEQSDVPKQVQHFGFWMVFQQSCNQIHQNPVGSF